MSKKEILFQIEIELLIGHPSRLAKNHCELASFIEQVAVEVFPLKQFQLFTQIKPIYCQEMRWGKERHFEHIKVIYTQPTPTMKINKICEEQP